MLIIPVQPAPAQQLAVTLAGQPCILDLYQKRVGLFLDLYVNDALIVGGVLCLNKGAMVINAYLGFAGELVFIDQQGNEDPVYTGLGSRWPLFYLEPADFFRS